MAAETTWEGKQRGSKGVRTGEMGVQAVCTEVEEVEQHIKCAIRAAKAEFELVCMQTGLSRALSWELTAGIMGVDVKKQFTLRDSLNPHQIKICEELAQFVSDAETATALVLGLTGVFKHCGKESSNLAGAAQSTA